MMDNMNGSGQDMKRLQFFNDSLVYLSIASRKGFTAFKECATLIRNKLNTFPLELSKEFLGAKLDKVSMDIFPTQEFPDLVPVKVLGDGNCLPRSASMLVFGDQQHHVEMRVRMACELALHEDFYLNNESHKMYDFDTFPYCTTITTYSASFKPGMDTHQDTIELVFKQDTMKTAKMGNYCGIWHLYALASIVGCRMYSIYPKLKSTVTIRPEINRIIFPRKQMSKRKLAVFWTNTNGLKGESFWSPNHFAPCFQKHFLLQAKQAATLKKLACNTLTKTPTKQNVKFNIIVPDTPTKLTKKKIRVDSPSIRSLTGADSQTRKVRFNVESKCDLAISFVTKQTRKVHVKSIKKGKNPLKSLFKILMGHPKVSRGPDVSFYEIE